MKGKVQALASDYRDRQNKMTTVPVTLETEGKG